MIDFRKNNKEKLNLYFRNYHLKHNPKELINCQNCGKFLMQNNTKHIFCDHKCCNKFHRKTKAEQDKLYHFYKYVTKKDSILARQRKYNKENTERKRELRYNYYLRNKDDLHKQERIHYHLGIRLPLNLVKKIENSFYKNDMGVLQNDY